MTILNLRFGGTPVLKRRADEGFPGRARGSTYASQYGHLLPLRHHSSLAAPTEAMPFVYTTNLSEVRVLAETLARRAGLAEDRIVDFVIAVSEIAANTVRHARTQGSMEIWSEAGEIVCEMRDGGVIADPASAGRLPPSADANGGHGLWLARQICDRMDLHSDGNGTIIRLHMALPPRQARDSPGPSGTATTPDVALSQTLPLPDICHIHRMYIHGRWRFSAAHGGVPARQP
jgi:anti-sigma regulatory factor (Ser/Thr protein kinase)